jgi:hypothetical protein
VKNTATCAVRAQHQRRGGPVVDRGGLADGGVGVKDTGPARQRQVAARRKRVRQSADDTSRILVIGHEMRDRDEQDSDWLAEVDQLPHPWVSQDRLGLAQVGQHDARVAVAGEQRAGMQMHDGTIIQGGNAHPRRDLLGDLVHIDCRGNAGADIDDLSDTSLADQEPHCPLQERPVLPRHRPYPRRRPQHFRRGFPVDQMVVLATEVIVIETRWVRPARVDLRRRKPGLLLPFLPAAKWSPPTLRRISVCRNTTITSKGEQGRSVKVRYGATRDGLDA